MSRPFILVSRSWEISTVQGFSCVCLLKRFVTLPDFRFFRCVCVWGADGVRRPSAELNLDQNLLTAKTQKAAQFRLYF